MAAVYNRFVDDTFAIFNDDDESSNFFGLLNNLHPDLRFTVEGEVDDHLPFMDVLVRREDHLRDQFTVNLRTQVC